MIYIVIIEDRHTDVKVKPFYDKERAINHARELAKGYCDYEEDYEEHDYGKDDGWLFYAQYSCESDSVRVVEVEMEDEVSI